MRLILFVFLPHFAYGLDYFWVGGSGNWSELRHWATTSGGNVLHDQIPTAADRVIFDERSFTADGSRINLDLDNIFCKDLDFRNIGHSLMITGPDQTVINIFGSLWMDPEVTLDFDGSFDFRGDETDNEINFAGQQPFQLRFLSSASWQVTGDVIVDSLVLLEFGTLTLGKVAIQCKRWEVFSTTGVNLNFGEADILITGDRLLVMPSYQWRESLHIEGPVHTDPGNSRITLTGIRATIGLYNLSAINLGQVVMGQSGGSHLVSANWAGDLVFQKLHLRGDSRLEGGFTMNDLELDGGNIYTLQSGLYQKVGALTTHTDCAMICHLRSSEGGIPSTIIALSGPQVVDHILLQDIHVQGVAYTADEAVDLGGNRGWIINERLEQTFYWVGGTGNWNDTNHWSFSSGGPPSGCLPTAVDDVIFDQVSFNAPNQRVIINVPSAFCHTMDWRMIPERAILQNLNSHQNLSLHIFGSLYFSPLTDNAFDGDVFFESFHGGNEIVTSENEFVKNVYFSSAAGEWELGDEMDVNDTLYFNSGSLKTNDHELECFRFYSQTSSRRMLLLGNSIFRIVPSTSNMYLSSDFMINAANFTIDPGMSTIIAEQNTYMHFYSNGVISFYRVIFQGHGGINVAEPLVTFKYGYFHHDGDFRGELQVDTLTFSPAKAYWIYMNSQLNVDSLSSHGTCDGAVFIAGYPKGIQGKIRKKTGILKVTNNMLEGITGEGGATFIAEASQDLGQNQGWTFMEASPRTLYWVGGDGLWFDRQHWSLSPGGSGGECVPTAIDDVIFDEHSFSGMYQNVGLTGSNAPICHNLTWTGAPNFTGINDGLLNITGSLYLQPNLSYFPWNTTFRSDSAGNEIYSGGNEMHWVDMMGSGTWKLTHEIDIPYQINLWQGTFNTNDYPLSTGHLHMGNYPVDFERKLILGSSHLIFEPMPIWDEQIYISSSNFEIDPGTSLAEFTGEFSAIKHYGSAILDLHNVLFSNIQGLSRVEEYEQAKFDFNKLEFHNNGLILNSNEMDTLLLAAGKLYRLEFNKTQTVYKHLRAIGNNCTPIGLESTEPGQRSTIFSSSATVIGDFIQMRDQRAAGGAHFSAGAHSTDISNNDGWIFEEDPDYVEIGFLGPDRTLCQDSIINLSAHNFSPEEQYLWSNQFKGADLQVATPGTYWAQVTFRDHCVIRDSISIRDPLSLRVDLGSDTTLCDGEELELNGDVDFSGAQYRWQDNSTNPGLVVTHPGAYFLNVRAEGCDFTDTVQIDYQPLPVASIKGLKPVCEGDTLQLFAEVDEATYRWNDGSSGPGLTVMTDGKYWVELNLRNCLASDTVEVDFYPVPSFDLGRDTTLCEDESLHVAVSGDHIVYQWSDGGSSDQITIKTPGLYWLEGSLAHCRMRDSIRVDYKSKPSFPPLRDTSLCEGTQWLLDLREPGTTYQWNTGWQEGAIDITRPGEYRVSALLNGCERADSFRVSFEPPPVIDLGPDLVRCEGEEVIFSLTEAGLTYYWEDTQLSGRFTISETGTYRLTAQKLNCAVSDTIEAEFHPVPYFSLGPDRYLCPGEDFLIESDREYDQLTWQDGQSGISYSGSEAGIYWLEAEQNQCFYRDTVVIKSYQPPEIDLGKDTVICHDKTLKISAWHPQVQQYRWQDGSLEPEIVVTQPGLYRVQVDDGRCPAEFQIEVQFRECTYFYIYIPNAFTPNDDGLNDLYKPLLNPSVQIDNYLFEIYSRWGDRLFSTSDPEDGWDGTFRGQKYTAETFVSRVVVEYQDDEGRGTFEEAGSVLLVR